MMRALKQQGNAAGRLILDHQKSLVQCPRRRPPVTQDRVVPVDWTDMNGHMNEGRYGQIFSDAAEWSWHWSAPMTLRGARHQLFHGRDHGRLPAETHAGEHVEVHSRVTEGAGKKLRCFHEMRRA